MLYCRLYAGIQEDDRVILWMIAAFAAFFIKGLCGFANTLVFTSVMAFAEANKSISPVELLLGYPANLYMAYRNRKGLDYKTVLTCAVCMVLGAIPGALFLKRANVALVQMIFGAVVLVVAIGMWKEGDQGTVRKDPAAVKIVLGVLSGVLCGMFGIGVLLAAYLQRTSRDIREFRANISAIFFLENTFRIMTYGWTGILTQDVLVKACLLVPAGALGLLCGIWCSEKMDSAKARQAVILVLIVSGCAMIIKNLPW
ncbi:MAG: sulfite exporter TauE/SafE family protein [Solobacterium sp.]|nr:sulfite exporter TauE/SafE family protein [Solobacterium sp.]